MIWIWFLLTAPISVCWHRLVWCRQKITLYEPILGAWRRLGWEEEWHWQCACGWRKDCRWTA